LPAEKGEKYPIPGIEFRRRFNRNPQVESTIGKMGIEEDISEYLAVEIPS
jgi:hypothetical protein